MLNSLIQRIRILLNQHKSFDDTVKTWHEAKSITSGYESNAILRKVEAAYLESQEKNDSYERDSVVFNDGKVNWTLIAMIYWSLSHISNEIKVLDFGGSFASQYFQNKKFLQQIDIKWSVVEQKNYVLAARKVVLDSNILFYDRLIECLTEENPNFAFFGSSLQYLEEPYHVLESLSSQGIKILILDRTPMHQGEKDIVVAQRVSSHIYNASYPAWIFCEDRLISSLSNDWTLISVYNSIGGQLKTRKGIRFNWKGHVYISKKLPKV